MADGRPEADEGKRAREWDARYAAAEGGLFGDAPCAWLRDLFARPGFAPRSALLPADGDGRNGAWLAARGLAVTAVDLSPEAARRARARDAALGARAERVVADLAAWRPAPERRWDLCAIFFLQGPRALRLKVIGDCAGALAPGGWLALEGFAASPASSPASGPAAETPPCCGPADDDKLYRLADARAAAEAAGLRIVEALEGETLLDDGPRHQGMARIVRLLAQGPC